MNVYLTHADDRVYLDFVSDNGAGSSSAVSTILTEEQFSALFPAYVTSTQYGERTVVVDEIGKTAGKPIDAIPPILEGHYWISEY